MGICPAGSESVIWSLAPRRKCLGPSGPHRVAIAFTRVRADLIMIETGAFCTPSMSYLLRTESGDWYRIVIYDCVDAGSFCLCARPELWPIRPASSPNMGSEAGDGFDTRHRKKSPIRWPFALGAMAPGNSMPLISNAVHPSYLHATRSGDVDSPAIAGITVKLTPESSRNLLV
jgi:hypothetical protein